MAVTFNAQVANGSIAFNGTAVATLSTAGFANLVPAAGSNIIIIGMLSLNYAGTGVAPTGVTCTYNSVSMGSAVASHADSAGVVNGYIFGLPVGSSTTSAAMVASWTGNCTPYLMACCFNGANQTGGTTSCPNGAGNDGTSTTASVTITCATGDMTVNFGSSTTGGETYVSVANGTHMFDSTAGNQNVWAGYLAGTSPNVTQTFNVTPSAPWFQLGVDIAAAASSIQNNQSLILTSGTFQTVTRTVG